MRWAQHPSLNRGQHRGFTLIELMVVVALIGLVSTAVLLTLRPTERTMTATDLTLELREQMIALSQRATASQRWMGISFTHEAYQLWAYQESQWQRIATEQDFTIPNAFTHRLVQNGVDVSLPDEVPAEPMILIAPDGRINAFELEVDDGDTLSTLTDPFWFDPHQEDAS